MASNHFDDELKPDAEANRIISDSDLINIDIKELNKMLKERGIAKVMIHTYYLIFIINQCIDYWTFGIMIASNTKYVNRNCL